MTEELPSDWHLAEALRRENPGWNEGVIAEAVTSAKKRPIIYLSTIAHARTLAEFMKEPVDPLLVMAREICVKVAEMIGNRFLANRYRAGDYDHFPEVQFVLECLRKAKAGDV